MSPMVGVFILSHPLIQQRHKFVGRDEEFQEMVYIRQDEEGQYQQQREQKGRFLNKLLLDLQIDVNLQVQEYLMNQPGSSSSSQTDNTDVE